MKKICISVMSIVVVCCALWSANVMAASGKMGEKIDIKTLEDLPEVPEGLEESEPITVKGDTTVEITNRLIKTNGNGIIVSEESDVVISNCYIVAGEVGLKVSENGTVEIKDSFILGGVAALLVADEGDASASETIFRGSVVISDNGDFGDEGDNTFIKLYPEEDE
jgi:hypothetical protein